MAGYKVSYKVLRQQGEDLKAVAKQIDGYAERVTQISGKLGNDEMLAEVRRNLQTLKTQLGESRAVLNTAGELLSRTVESYGVAETRQVKKVDGIKAHNRDFYKKPIVVASAGAAAAAAAVASVKVTGGAGGGTTTHNTTVNNYYGSSEAPAATPATQDTPAGTDSAPAPAATATPLTAAKAEPVTAAASASHPNATVGSGVTEMMGSKGPPVTPEPVVAAAPTPTPTPTPAHTTAAPPATGPSAGAVAGALGGTAAAAGATLGGIHMKKKRSAARAAAENYDPEVELERVRQEIRDMENQE